MNHNIDEKIYVAKAKIYLGEKIRYKVNKDNLIAGIILVKPIFSNRRKKIIGFIEAKTKQKIINIVRDWSGDGNYHYYHTARDIKTTYGENSGDIVWDIYDQYSAHMLLSNDEICNYFNKSDEEINNMIREFRQKGKDLARKLLREEEKVYKYLK